MDDYLEKAKSYQKSKHFLAISIIVIELAFFIVLIFSGGSEFIANLIQTMIGNFYIQLLLYLSVVGLLLNFIGLPIEYSSSFNIEHAYGLSKQSLSSWVKDYFKKLVIGGLLSCFMLLLLFALLKNTKDAWWIYTSILYFLISLVIAKIFPVFIIPIFYKLTPIEDSPLKAKLFSLGKSLGVNILNIYNIALGKKTTKANAAVCGIGSTKRILLSDTLLDNYADDEVEATLAHELSHHKHHHFWKLSIMGFILTTVCFFIIHIVLKKMVLSGAISHIYDIKAIPAIAIIYTVYNLLTRPVSNLVSRNYEREADSDAFAVCANPLSFATLMDKLSKQNLSDPSPSKLVKIFFYDHPPASERIEACRDYINKNR